VTIYERYPVLSDNPLANMHIFTRVYPIECPGCGCPNIKRLDRIIDDPKYDFIMDSDENVFQCQDEDECGMIWDEDWDP
jgi:hypothetical protein